MKCAYEIYSAVEAKMAAEAEAKRQAKLQEIAKALVHYKASLPSIDEYVEQKLINGNGVAYLMIDRSIVDGFWYFSEQDCRYGIYQPYWHNKKMSEPFPLDTYIEYLREHCFNVELQAYPFTAYSSTGKSSQKKDGITMKISVSAKEICKKA